MLKIITLLLSILVFSGCGTGPQKVDAYADLLGPNTLIVDSPQSVSVAQLRNARIGLVSGANFENYIARWEKQRKDGPPPFWPLGAQRFASDLEKTSPTVAARHALAALKPIGSRMEIFDDFKQAAAAGVDWIIVFDVWNRYAGGFTPTYETRAGLYLLTPNLVRVIKVEIDNTDKLYETEQFFGFMTKAISNAATTFIGSLKN